MKVYSDRRMELGRRHSQRLRLEDLQEAVGGRIQFISCGDVLPTGRELAMVINEEGKLNGMPENELATLLAQKFRAIYVWDEIVGPVLLVTSDKDGNTLALTMAEEAAVAEMIGELAA